MGKLMHVEMLWKIAGNGWYVSHLPDIEEKLRIWIWYSWMCMTNTVCTCMSYPFYTADRAKILLFWTIVTYLITIRLYVIFYLRGLIKSWESRYDCRSMYSSSVDQSEPTSRKTVFSLCFYDRPSINLFVLHSLTGVTVFVVIMVYNSKKIYLFVWLSGFLFLNC